MRFNLIDVFFMFACEAIGMVVGQLLCPHLPGYVRPIAMPLGALCMYLALMYPFYRGLRLYPMVLPRCPCCRSFQHGFHILDVRWPRIVFRCPTCEGEFVVWHNGKPGGEETWEKPVLALKWPYAWGIYKRAKNRETGVAPDSGSADAPPASAG
jgi:hypothetical protein